MVNHLLLKMKLPLQSFQPDPYVQYDEYNLERDKNKFTIIQCRSFFDKPYQCTFRKAHQITFNRFSHIIIDNHRHIFNINTTTNHVSCNQDIFLTTFKTCQSKLSLFLSFTTMKCTRVILKEK